MSPRCKISLERLTIYFQEEYAADANITLENPPNWLSQCLKAGDDPSEWDSVPILSEEVKNQLNHLPGNSAPGLDRLPYKV